MRTKTEHAFPSYIERNGPYSRRYYGGGDSPPPQQSTAQSQIVFSPEEQAQRNKIFSAAEEAYGKAKTNYASIVNPAAKPVTPSADTTTAQNMVRSFATGQGTDIANAGAGALKFGLSGEALDPNRNPGFQTSLNTALRKVDEKYTDAGGVLSNIRSNFNASAPSGQSSREGIAMGLAGKSYLNTIGDVTGSMTSDAYNKGLDLMKSSMAFAPNMYNLGVQPGISVGAVGTQQEGYQAQQNAYDAAGTSWNLNKDWAALNPYASIITGMQAPGVSSSSTAPGPRSPGAMGVLGGAAMGASVGATFGMPMVGAAAGALLGILDF